MAYQRSPEGKARSMSHSTMDDQESPGEPSQVQPPWPTRYRNLLVISVLTVVGVLCTLVFAGVLGAEQTSAAAAVAGVGTAAVLAIHNRHDRGNNTSRDR